MERVFEEIRKKCPISPETERLLSGALTACHFSKRERLIKQGCYANAAFFIERGMTRSFWLVDGEEITTSFSTEGTLVFSMDEIYFGKASEEYVEAVEDIDGYRIDAHRLRELVSSNIELAVWWGKIHEHEYRRIHQSHKERLTLPARERYEAFRRQFPDVCRRAQRGHIASYLGITLSTLSRISGI